MFTKTIASIAALLVIALVIAGTARADGALAVAKDRFASGYSYGFSGKADAFNAALSACGNDCTIVADFAKTCAAFAASENLSHAWASAIGGTPAAARQNAIIACAKAGGTACQVRVWACDR